MQAPSSSDLVLSSPVSIWPDARQRLSGRRAMPRQGHANPTLSVRAVDATVSSSHVSFWFLTGPRPPFALLLG
jgi:hypothetical protein